jgi:hypothetical protein
VKLAMPPSKSRIALTSTSTPVAASRRSDAWMREGSAPNTIRDRLIV